MFFFKIYEPEKRDRHDPLHIRPPERIWACWAWIGTSISDMPDTVSAENNDQMFADTEVPQ
jgi:hypothetical protein